VARRSWTEQEREIEGGVKEYFLGGSSGGGAHAGQPAAMAAMYPSGVASSRPAFRAATASAAPAECDHAKPVGCAGDLCRVWSMAAMASLIGASLTACASMHEICLNMSSPAGRFKVTHSFMLFALFALFASKTCFVATQSERFNANNANNANNAKGQALSAASARRSWIEYDRAYRQPQWPKFMSRRKCMRVARK
jgi:hypothetical protein